MRIAFGYVQLLAFRVNQMLYQCGCPGDDVQFQAKPEPESTTSPWNDRVLIAAVVVTMLLSLLGYMHA
ncbi:MAG: hypothetical protein DMG61_19550 [Acidobacteria bacterium]|nr:MAG: hypothetical protein DMG61_19550 [Acidobacteriota bacterium]PYY17270.1 MAG: hypothetical protein DMG60_12190 [Acidobacteriota bacterium]